MTRIIDYLIMSRGASMSVNMNIGQIVRIKRETLNLSQRDLERRAGSKITQTKIAKLENGAQPNVTIESLRALAEGFGCSVVDLLPEEDKHPRQ